MMDSETGMTLPVAFWLLLSEQKLDSLQTLRGRVTLVANGLQYQGAVQLEFSKALTPVDGPGAVAFASRTVVKLHMRTVERRISPGVYGNERRPTSLQRGAAFNPVRYGCTRHGSTVLHCNGQQSAYDLHQVGDTAARRITEAAFRL